MCVCVSAGHIYTDSCFTQTLHTWVWHSPVELIQWQLHSHLNTDFKWVHVCCICHICMHIHLHMCRVKSETRVNVIVVWSNQHRKFSKGVTAHWFTHCPYWSMLCSANPLFRPTVFYNHLCNPRPPLTRCSTVKCVLFNSAWSGSPLLF